MSNKNITDLSYQTRRELSQYRSTVSSNLVNGNRRSRRGFNRPTLNALTSNSRINSAERAYGSSVLLGSLLALSACDCGQEPDLPGVYRDATADASTTNDGSEILDSGSVLDAVVNSIDAGFDDMGNPIDAGSLDSGSGLSDALFDAGFTPVDGGFGDGGDAGPFSIDGGFRVPTSTIARIGRGLGPNQDVIYGTRRGYNLTCTSTDARLAMRGHIPLRGHEGNGTGVYIPSGHRLSIFFDTNYPGMVNTDGCGVTPTFNSLGTQRARLETRDQSGRTSTSADALYNVKAF
ncbi:MAG TPA: hypothetical protein VJI68_02240 [Candidatus Nanoarchaeia archaeon]|nr:hypothetical protein [Candidatus Nanoarchaeia archaeon]